MLPRERPAPSIRVSFALLTHNEERELRQLFEFLAPYMRNDREVVIVDDFSDPATAVVIEEATRN